MGIGSFFKRLVQGAPETLEGEFEETDEELEALWHERESLPASNRGFLRVEFAARALPFPANLPYTSVETEEDEETDAGPRAPLEIDTYGAITIETAGGAYLVRLPTWHGESAPTELPPERIIEVQEGAPLPDTSDGLAFAWILEGSHPVLQVGDESGAWRMLVGSRIPMEACVEHEATHLVGGLAAPKTEEEATALSALAEEEELTLVEAYVAADAMGVAPLLTQVNLLAFGVGSTLLATRLPPEDAAVPFLRASEGADLPEAPDPEAVGNAIGYLVFEGKMNQAARLLEWLPEDVAQTGPVHFAVGCLASALGDTERAMAAFREALSVDPPYGRAACNLAAMGEEDIEALTAQAQETIARHPVAEYNRAVVLWATGKREEALLQVQDIQLEVTPWTRGLLELTVDEGDPATEKPQLRRCVHYVGEAYALATWALTSDDADIPDLAVTWIHRALALDPTFAEAAAVVHELALNQDDHETARTVLERAIDAQPCSVPLRFLGATHAVRAGRFDDAIADYRRCLAWLPDLSDMGVNLALALSEAGDFEGMQAAIDALVEQAEDDRVVRQLEKVRRIREQTD